MSTRVAEADLRTENVSGRRRLNSLELG